MCVQERQPSQRRRGPRRPSQEGPHAHRHARTPQERSNKLLASRLLDPERQRSSAEPVPRPLPSLRGWLCPGESLQQLASYTKEGIYNSRALRARAHSGTHLHARVSPAHAGTFSQEGLGPAAAQAQGTLGSFSPTPTAPPPALGREWGARSVNPRSSRPGTSPSGSSRGPAGSAPPPPAHASPWGPAPPRRPASLGPARCPPPPAPRAGAPSP